MSEYQTIEVNGTTLILNEDMAINLYHALAREFHWAGTFFTPEDVSSIINQRREADDKEPLEGDELEEAVNSVVGSRDWHRWLPDWLTQQGWEIIDTVIHENVEQEVN